MSYSKTVWVDDSTPAIDAAHLNNIEDGIEAIDVSLSSALSDIATNTSDIATNATDIASKQTSIDAINAIFSEMVIVRGGTFSGTWNPTLSSTFGFTNASNYNWLVTVRVSSYSVQNGAAMVLTGYLDVDGDTLHFVSTQDSAPVNSYYSLIGIKKSVSTLAAVNQ